MAHPGPGNNEEVKNDNIEHEKNKEDVNLEHLKQKSQNEEQEQKTDRDDDNVISKNNDNYDNNHTVEKEILTNETKRNNCERCKSTQSEIDQLKAEKIELEKQLSALKVRIEIINSELEREVQRRCDLEQRFTEEAKRSTDQIEELIAKSDQDDVKLNEIKKKLDLYIHETSSMIESFTTNREVLTSQLLELRQENDYLLGKFIGKSRDLQNEEINLPQTVEELQFHCLTLNEKLILATLAKEQLEETLMQNTSETR